jgi:hypothetical protein
MDAFGCCDCGGENCFNFTIRTAAPTLTVDKPVPRSVCACPKCLLVGTSHRAEVFLIDTSCLSSTGSTLLDCDNTASESQSTDGHMSIMICDVCKLCVGYRFSRFGLVALSRRVVKATENFPTVPAATLSKHCTEYFSGDLKFIARGHRRC